jgi:hypothetical protein
MQSTTQPESAESKQPAKHAVHYSHPKGWTAKQVAHFASNFHPTRVLYELEGRHMVWDSRAHRLGRFPKLKLHPSENKRLEVPPLRLFGFEWGNISWGVAQLFVWGKYACRLHSCVAALLDLLHYTWSHAHAFLVEQNSRLITLSVANVCPPPGSVAWVVNGVYAYYVSHSCAACHHCLTIASCYTLSIYT